MIDRRSLIQAGSAALAGFALPRFARADTGVLRIASVKFGSLSWLLETIRAEGLDKKHGLALEIIDVPSNQAGPVALLSGGADVIVSDWTWAMRQRSLGERVKFSPYSSALGSVVVPGDSSVKSVADLKDKTLGVAGSAIDKSWLLLRVYTRRVVGTDIATLAKASFGAPPLMAEELRAGRLDAVLNFWTYAARLTGSGYTSILDMDQVLAALGVEPVPAMVGFVWRESYEAEHGAALNALLRAAAEGNAILAKSDQPWQRLKTLMKPASDAEFQALIKAYRSGIPSGWGPGELRSAEKLMGLLVEAGDKELMGNNTQFDANLFHQAQS